MNTQKFTVQNLIISGVMAFVMFVLFFFFLLLGDSLTGSEYLYGLIVYAVNAVISYIYASKMLQRAVAKVEFTAKDDKRNFFTTNVLISLGVPYLFVIYFFMSIMNNNKVISPLGIISIVIMLIFNYVLLSKKVKQYVS